MSKIPNLKNAVEQVRAVAKWQSYERAPASISGLATLSQINTALFERLVGGASAARLDETRLRSLARATTVFEAAISGAFQSEAFTEVAANWSEFFLAELPVNQRKRLGHALRDTNTVFGMQCLLVAVGRSLHGLAVERKNGTGRRKNAGPSDNTEFPVEKLPAYVRKLIKKEPALRAPEYEAIIHRLLEPRPVLLTYAKPVRNQLLESSFDIRRFPPPWKNVQRETLWLTKILHEMGWPLPLFITKDLPKGGPSNTLDIDQVRWLIRRSKENVLTVAVSGAVIAGLPESRAVNIARAADENGWTDDQLASFGFWPYSQSDVEELAGAAALLPADPQTIEEKIYCQLILIGQAGWPLPGFLTRLFPRHWVTAVFDIDVANRLLPRSGVSALHMARAGARIGGLSGARVDVFVREIARGPVPPKTHALRILLEGLEFEESEVIIQLLPRMAKIIDKRDSSEGLRLTIADIRSANAMQLAGLIEDNPDFDYSPLDAAPVPVPSVVTLDDRAGAKSIASASTPNSAIVPAELPLSPRRKPSRAASASRPENETQGRPSAQGVPTAGAASDEEFSLDALVGDAGFATEGRYRRKAQP